MAAQEGEGQGEEIPWKDCLGQKEASELDNALFFDYEFSIDQLMEIAGLCVAEVSSLGWWAVGGVKRCACACIVYIGVQKIIKCPMPASSHWVGGRSWLRGERSTVNNCLCIMVSGSAAFELSRDTGFRLQGK